MNTRRLRRLIHVAIAAGTLGLGAVAIGLFTHVPEMKTQPKLQTHAARMPLPPAGAVTVERPAPVRFPDPADTRPLASGQVYYGYYCLPCHGQTGDGRGPVGESYHPVPRDLRSAAIQARTNKQLLRAIAEGTGHQLENDGPRILHLTVPPQHAGPLIAYVRTLKK
ncbi:MAG: hypothetical protein FWE88_00750 [Phycisphaerae bacterium]|nr:hypothetical protein [Phycisphaerae bacterium]